MAAELHFICKQN